MANTLLRRACFLYSSCRLENGRISDPQLVLERSADRVFTRKRVFCANLGLQTWRSPGSHTQRRDPGSATMRLFIGSATNSHTTKTGLSPALFDRLGFQGLWGVANSSVIERQIRILKAAVRACAASVRVHSVYLSYLQWYRA